MLKSYMRQLNSAPSCCCRASAAEFDADLLLKKLPQILGIEEKRVRMLLKELVGSRKRMLLVQAVSQNRQRRPNDAVTSLNNLISAYRASPENAETAGVGVVSWGEREELKDLYSLYCSKVRALVPPVLHVMPVLLQGKSLYCMYCSNIRLLAALNHSRRPRPSEFHSTLQ